MACPLHTARTAWYLCADYLPIKRARGCSNVTDFLDQKRAEITNRLSELRPLVDEFHRLEAAAAALAGLKGPTTTTATAAPVRRGPGRPRGSRNATRTSRATSAARKPAAGAAPAATPKTRPAAARSTGRRPGRRRGSGARAAQTLTIVQEQPKGITIPELAAKMGIKQNYLYRVLPGLQKEGKVRKSGRTWYPKAA